METKISRRFSIEQCRVNFKDLFIYGDNGQRIGMGGTACIREQKNAIGLISKHKPSTEPSAYFSDADYVANCTLIDEDIVKIKEYAKETEAISYVFPFGGIGNGLALLPIKAPLTYCYLTEQLIKNFGFNNLAGVFKEK